MTQQGTQVQPSGGGLGFTGALTLLFIGLRLTNVIHWSLVWVLAPLWISAVVVFLIGLVVGMVVLVAKDNKRRRY